MSDYPPKRPADGEPDDHDPVVYLHWNRINCLLCALDTRKQRLDMQKLYIQRLGDEANPESWFKAYIFVRRCCEKRGYIIGNPDDTDAPKNFPDRSGPLPYGYAPDLNNDPRDNE